LQNSPAEFLHLMAKYTLIQQTR